MATIHEPLHLDDVLYNER